MVKRKEPDKLDTILLNLQIVVSLLTELPEVIKLKERLAEQASHVKRLLRDNELFREQLAEDTEDHGLWKPPDVECPHTSFTRVRDEDGHAVYNCLDCGEDFED